MIKRANQRARKTGFFRVPSSFNPSLDDQNLHFCKKDILSVERNLYSYLLILINFATSSHFTRAAVLILFVITVHLFAHFTGWFREPLTHGKARAWRPGSITETKHGTVLLWNKFTDRVYLSFVVTALKRKKSF